MPIRRSAPISAVHKPAGLKSASHLSRAGTMRVCVAASQPRRRPAARFPSLDTGGPEHLSIAQAHLSSPVNVGPRRSGCVHRTRTYFQCCGRFGSRDGEIPRVPSAISPVSAGPQGKCRGPPQAATDNWSGSQRPQIPTPWEAHDRGNFAVGLGEVRLAPTRDIQPDQACATCISPA
jgi:hypothetical protein